MNNHLIKNKRVNIMSGTWFLDYDDGKKIGPISEGEAREYV
jgi:hypothetical protein